MRNTLESVIQNPSLLPSTSVNILHSGVKSISHKLDKHIVLLPRIVYLLFMTQQGVD